MSRLLLVAALGLVFCGSASAQCQRWYPPYPVIVPAYPLSPAIWGAPVPRPLPPAPTPFVPKSAPAIREDAEPAKPKEGAKGGSESKDTPRIPKTKLPIPGDPLDKSIPDVPKLGGPKKDGPTEKSFEQFVIPADGRGEPRAQVKVGFFNHSEREIVLDVNGEPLRLPKEQYVTVRLPRTFTWAEKGAKGTDVVVPPDADGIEIVFRR